MSVVIFAEKPSQAKAYADALYVPTTSERKEGYYQGKNIFSPDEELIITYGYGHLVQLEMPEAYLEEWKTWKIETLPLIPPTFQYRISDSGKKQFYLAKKLLDHADTIIIATDIDREGELIARLVLNECHLKENVKLQRLWSMSLEVEDIQKAFQHLKDGEETENLYYEALTRSHLDWLFGMNFSRATTLKFQEKNTSEVFKIGRVKTPTVRLVVEREREIQQFTPETFYQLLVEVENGGEKFTFKHPERFASKEKVQAFIDEKHKEQPYELTIKDVSSKKQEVLSPMLFKLASLQKYMHANVDWSFKKTLEIAQKLYDKKLLTYPRTDSEKIPPEVFAYLKENVEKYAKESEIDDSFNIHFSDARPRYVSKDTGSHHAIVPTRVVASSLPFELTKEEELLYQTVMTRTLQMFLPPQEKTTVSIQALFGNLPIQTNKTFVTELGWASILEEEKADVSEESSENPSNINAWQSLEKGLVLPATPNTHEGETKPKPRYSQATLAGNDGDMEKAQLGTPATRGNILNELLESGFFEEKNKRIHPCSKAHATINFLEQERLTQVEYTANLEEKLQSFDAYLSNVAKEVYEEMVEKTKEDVAAAIERIKALSVTPEMLIGLSERKEKSTNQTTLTCPKCHTEGLVLTKKALFCPVKNDEGEYSCKYIVNRNFFGHALSEEELTELWTTHETAKEIKLSYTNKETGKTSQWKAKLLLDDKGEISYQTKEKDTLEIPCPICKGKIFTTEDAIYCENYKKCNVSISRKIGKPKLTDKLLLQVLKEKKSENLITFYSSKKKKEFQAYLILDDSEGFSFDFPERTPYPTVEGITCPKCHQAIQDIDAEKDGKDISRFVCSSGRDNCNFVLFKRPFHLTEPLTVNDLEALLNGETTDLKVAIGKSGKPYETFLKFSDDFTSLENIFV